VGTVSYVEEHALFEAVARTANLDVGCSREHMRRAVDLGQGRAVDAVDGAAERNAERDAGDGEREARAVRGEHAREEHLQHHAACNFPADKRSTRSAREAASGECVTSTAAAPERFTASRRQSRTVAALAASRVPVGSPAST